MKLAKLFVTIFVLSIKREIAFRANLAISSVQALVTTGAGLATIGVVYHQTDELVGWSLGEALVLLGTFQIVTGLLMTFIEPNVQWFAQSVATGQLDEKLLKPVSSLFLASLGTHAPFGLVQALLGVGLVIAGQREIGNATGLSNIGGWLAMLLVSLAIAWATRVGLAIIALWMPALELGVVYHAVWQFARYPVAIYGQPLRFALTWVLPLTLISTAPATALARGIPWPTFLIAAGISFVGIALVQRLWTLGLRRYTSATS